MYQGRYVYMHVEVTGATVRSETLLVDTAGEDAEQPQHAIAAAALALWPIPRLPSFVLAGGERQLGETGADEQGGGSDRGGKPKQNRKPEPPLPPDHPKTQKNGKQGAWGKRRNCGNNGTGRKHGNRPLGPNRDNGGGRGEGGNMGSGAPALNTAMRIDLCDRNKEAESQRPDTRPIVAISACEKGYIRSQTARDE